MEIKQNINKRELAFDILRVIAMCMVVVIHVSNVYSRSFGIISNKSFLVSLGFNTISRVSVPIFLMISGALLVDRSFNKNKYFKRIIKYLILIIVWDIIYLLWEYFYLGITYNRLYMLFIEPYRAHLWFLYTILTIYIIQPLLKLILDKSSKTIKILLLLIWFILSTLSLVNYNIASIFTIFSYIGFFIIGKYLYDYIKNNNLKKYNLLFILLIIINISLSIYFNYTYSLKYNRFYNLFFAYRSPFIIISSLALFILVITNYRKEKLPKIIKYLSEVSLGVYLIHGIFLDITIKLFNYQLTNVLYGIPLFALIILILSIISVSILKKIKYVNYIID